MKISTNSFLGALEAQMKDVCSAASPCDTNGRNLSERLEMQKKQDEKQKWILHQMDTEPRHMNKQGSSVRSQSNNLKPKKSRSAKADTGAVPKSSLRVKDRSYSNDSQYYDFQLHDSDAEFA